ncbi:Hypothetical predicted protein [Paramuricea clavata]|uniref:Uncharacterized protein n=1 Tax=Paramuricea clavata TaxID=317549 RepID=A0A6S7G8F7_PARCT|nr:Hypothetical predicted protein [Paramuricea clavata]
MRIHVENPFVLYPNISEEESDSEDLEDNVGDYDYEVSDSNDESDLRTQLSSCHKSECTGQKKPGSQLMPVARFDKLQRFFHCNDNFKIIPAGQPGHDKLIKVRPVIESVVTKCRKVPQEEKHSVDEQIIPTKSRTSLKQFCPKKPNKWGIKVWARCGIADSLIRSGKVVTQKRGRPSLERETPVKQR